MKTPMSAREHDILQNVMVYLAFNVPNLSKTKLNKLVLLADFYHYTKYGRRITHVPFIHYNYGPWSIVIEQKAMEHDGDQIKIETIEGSTKGDITLIKPNVPETQVRLSRQHRETLDRVINDWGYKPLDEIAAYIKRTTLFTSTPFNSKIKFRNVKPNIESRKILSTAEERELTNFMTKNSKLLGRSSLAAVRISE